MPIDNEDFFKTRKDWSRRKHLILDHYLLPATAKLRSVSPDRRVFILDGFAGPGHYENEDPGSPVHTSTLADKMRSWDDPVTLRIHNVEPKPRNYAALEACTSEWAAQGIVTNHHARFRAALPAVLDEAAASPLLAFLDPFKPKHLPFADIVPLLKRTAKTELLIVFHSRNVARVVDQVRPQAATSDKNRRGSMLQLDAIFGGNQWQRILEEETTEVDAVVDCFIGNLVEHFRQPRQRLFVCDTPIEARHGVGLKYHVIFMTRNVHGVFLMNDAFTKEKRDVHSKTAVKPVTGMAALFDEYADPMDEAQRPAGVRNAILEATQNCEGERWSFETLMVKAIEKKLGQFTETDYKQGVRDLLASTSNPRLVGVEGTKRQDGKWKVESNLILRLEN